MRFRDIDAFRHVNNASFFTYIEEARIRYLIDVLRLDAVERMPMILAAVKIDFRAPILFGQEVDIGTSVDWIGRSSFAMAHRLIACESPSMYRPPPRLTSTFPNVCRRRP